MVHQILDGVRKQADVVVVAMTQHDITACILRQEVLHHQAFAGAIQTEHPVAMRDMWKIQAVESTIIGNSLCRNIFTNVQPG